MQIWQSLPLVRNVTMILPVTRNSVCALADLPRSSGQIPTAQEQLEVVRVADFAAWLDDHLSDLEWRHRDDWTRESTLDAIFSGTKRRRMLSE
jgi:hypothetical protein